MVLFSLVLTAAIALFYPTAIAPTGLAQGRSPFSTQQRSRLAR
ncbi:hypothetical protein AB3R30_26405 [Leptolyngbyaceae cyanobacterium UHCC 1019]